MSEPPKYTNPPGDILKAAIMLEQWATESGLKDWELAGICSRSFATKYHELMDKSSSVDLDLRIWQVRELIDQDETPKREETQDCFVIALTAIEAANIVGEDERRRIIRVEDACPISKLPGDKYKVVAKTPNA
jgi:hypothetical protein